MWSFWKQQCLFSTLSLHVIPRHSDLTPDRPALYTTTHALIPVLLPTSPTTGDVCKEFKKTWKFVSDLQICCRFTTHNSETTLKTNEETNKFVVCLFVLFPQLNLYIPRRNGKLLIGRITSLDSTSSLVRPEFMTGRLAYYNLKWVIHQLREVWTKNFQSSPVRKIP